MWVGYSSIEREEMNDDELKELHANAARYELMRDVKIYEMQQYKCLPVPIEEMYDWFDAMIDKRIRSWYPNATIGKVK